MGSYLHERYRVKLPARPAADPLVAGSPLVASASSPSPGRGHLAPSDYPASRGRPPVLS